jgi:membrane associated rhomboid family serine protease
MRRIGKSEGVIRQQGPLLALMALMFVIFFFQVILQDVWYAKWMAVPGNIVMSWENLRSGTGTAADLRELSTLLSCAFLHGGIDHLLNNMLFLWVFGALVAELLGQRWMLGIFLATAIGASLTHAMMNRTEFIPMLGASGVVMGFEGAYLGLAVRFRLPNPHIWPMARPIPPAHLALLAVIGVSFDYAAVMQGVNAGIAYGAHIGGFTTGLVIAAIAAPPPR